MILKEPKLFVKEWKEQIKEKVKMFNESPKLAIVQVGNLEASNRYVRNKLRDCEEVGIYAKHFQLKENIEEDELINFVQKTQQQFDAILVQLPLPENIDKNKIINVIDKNKDVDGFRQDAICDPCTPGGIMRYLNWCGYDLKGKDVCIFGRSETVGRPLARMMVNADATVTLCNRYTDNTYRHAFGADLIVTAVGKSKFLNCYPIHVPVIDVGINFDENGKICGDCINTENRDVTPVPGGVGLMTRCMLLENVIKCKEINQL